MSEITAIYVYKVVGQASEGVETRDLVEGLGLVPDGPIDPSQMVPSEDYYDFFAAVAERDPSGVELPLRIGAAMRCDEYGAFGLAWKSAPNLNGSFLRSERYGRVLGNAETYAIEPGGEGVYFRLEKDGADRLGKLLSNEASMAAVVAICQEASSAPFTPLGIFFKHAPRGDTAIYTQHFGCPVHFETSRDAVLVNEESLAVPNTLGDPSIVRFFDQHLEQQLAKLDDPNSLEKRVQMAVAQLLSEGVPTLSRIATNLGIGARTLQRRLSERGLSFQNLVEQSRRELAQNLLRETDYSLAEIAFLTGFAELSGFTRAF